MKKENCTFNENGFCKGQKNMPPCDKTCISYVPRSTLNKNISVDIVAEMKWEKLCRYLISEYSIDVDKLYIHIKDNIFDFVDIKLER